MQVHIVEEQKLHKDQDHITKNISWTEHMITETFKKKKNGKVATHNVEDQRCPFGQTCCECTFFFYK